MSLKKFLRSRERMVHLSKPLTVKRTFLNEARTAYIDETVVDPRPGKTLRLHPRGERNFRRWFGDGRPWDAPMPRHIRRGLLAAHA